MSYNTWGPPPSGYCCIKVYMSRNFFDFRDAARDFANISGMDFETHSCRAKCDRSPEVYINFTDDLFWRDRDIETEPMQTVYFTGSKSPRNSYTNLSAKEVFSFKQMFQNLMGDLLGLKPVEGTGCGDLNSVMGRLRTEDDAPGLTDADKCHFQKLYCPEAVGLDPALSVGIDETASALFFNVAPNPATSELRINFSRLVTGDGVTIRLINSLGETVLRQSLEKETQETFLDVSSLPDGWYMVEVAATTISFTKKILITE